MKKYRITVLMDDACIPGSPGDFYSQADVESTEFHVVQALQDLGHSVNVVGVDKSVDKITSAFKENRPDLVFNLTEQFRDVRSLDMNIAAFLEMLDIPFTGTGPIGLMLCRNKGLCKQLLSARKVHVPGFIVFHPGRRAHAPKTLKFPLVVKPVGEDGSDGISNNSLVNSQDELAERVRMVHERWKQPAIAEEYIEGRELYVGMLGNNRVKVLPPREIRFGSAEGGPVLATSKVKWSEEYQEKWSITFGFADLDPEVERKIARVCRRAYRVLNIRDYGRIDLRITPDNHIAILEANANPDIAYGEEVAEAARKDGIEYKKMISRIVQYAMKRSAG